jgi:hypothetical protein
MTAESAAPRDHRATPLAGRAGSPPDPRRAAGGADARQRPSAPPVAAALKAPVSSFRRDAASRRDRRRGRDLARHRLSSPGRPGPPVRSDLRAVPPGFPARSPGAAAGGERACRRSARFGQEQGGAHGGGGRGFPPVHRRGRRRRGFPGGRAGAGEVPRVRPAAGPGAPDPEGQPGEVQEPGYSFRDGPPGASFREAGAGAHFRGGFQAGVIRFPSAEAGAGRDRRDPSLRDPGISLGPGGRYRGVFRQHLASGTHEPDPGSNRGQAGPGPD